MVQYSKFIKVAKGGNFPILNASLNYPKTSTCGRRNDLCAVGRRPGDTRRERLRVSFLVAHSVRASPPPS